MTIQNRQSASERLGKNVTGAENVQQAIGKANLNWEVDKVQLKNPITGEPSDNYALIRDDNAAWLHTAKKGYEVCQNAQMFGVINELVGTENFALENAGSFGGGKIVFVQAKIGEFDLMASGDITKKYLTGINSHDGSISETYKEAFDRITCRNTLMMVLRDKRGREIKIKHTRNSQDRRNEAMAVLQAARETALNLQEKLEILAQRQVNSAIVGQTIAGLFKIDVTKELGAKTARQVMTIQELFESNDKNAFPQFKDTAYNLLNAATEYADHYRDTRAENGETDKQRAFSALFGSGDKFKQEAVDLVLELTRDARLVNQPTAYSFADTGLSILQ
jgi:phage/plasmid-like protein (TIGR03299 family)